jgi:1,4-dihydroxy-2-naphthoate octaprenyltransferase
MKSLRLFIQLSRPMNILSAILLYLLGMGIAHYLSGQINWNSGFIGLTWIVIILLGTQYLNEYFDPIVMYDNPLWKHTPFSGVSGAIGAGRLPRQVALWAGLTCLTIAASLTVLIIQIHGLSLVGILIFGLILLGELLYALPPFRLVSSGYGEVIMSIIVGGLIPALAFLLQGHDFHHILVMVAFPLTTLHIGMLLALEFPDYASDLKQGIKPILIRIGWQRGMIIHNIMILGSFVILGLAFVFGLPLRVGWPVFFVLPIGLFQIWMMNRIADGAKPNWNLLALVAASTFGLTAYILTFAFWTH